MINATRITRLTIGLLITLLLLTGCNGDHLFQTEIPHSLEAAQTQWIYTLGASTVRYDNNIPEDIGANHSQYPTRVGWGSELHNYMRYPENISNQGRRGATSGSYQIPHPEKGPAHWANTRQIIEDNGLSAGGFLLIQFGGTDNTAGVSEEDFKNNLRFYRTEALSLNLTPVFITPVEQRPTGPDGTRGPFPRYVREVAAEDDRSLLLDLHAKSLAVYLEQNTRNLGYEFGNVPYIWLGSGDFNRIDNTHFEERGAKIVAGWVRDLACELDDPRLANLFHEGLVLNTPVIYSHCEYIDDPGNPDLNGWYVADDQGNLIPDQTADFISEVHDDTLASNVVEFNQHPGVNFFVHGDWRDDSDRSWANVKKTSIEWKSLFTSGDFRIYIEIATTDGRRIMTYKPLDVDEGPGPNFPQYVRFGLGSDAADGTWKSFQRDLEADLKTFEPNNDIIQVNGFRMKGTGRLDDLRMF